MSQCTYSPSLQHGANVNESDFWGYTPLHEAAAKNKYEICRLLLEHGAQVDAKTREGQTPYDLLKDKDGDLADLLQGHRALLDAAKKGDLDRVSQGVGHLCAYVRTYVCACAFGGSLARPMHPQCLVWRWKAKERDQFSGLRGSNTVLEHRSWVWGWLLVLFLLSPYLLSCDVLQ